MAANSLVTVVRNVGSVFCFAIASAGTILLGRVMGQGELEKSKSYASGMLKMTVVAGAVGGVIVLAVTPFVLRFASLNDTAMHYLKYMLLINTYYIMGTAVNTTLSLPPTHLFTVIRCDAKRLDRIKIVERFYLKAHQITAHLAYFFAVFPLTADHKPRHQKQERCA